MSGVRALPRYRGALIGAGGVARLAHLPAFAVTADRLELAAVVDAEPGVRVPAGLPLFTSPDQLARAGRLDFIDVCTPTSTHLEMVIWGLERGYHVLCEKPVALTVAEARHIAAAARRAGRVVMPCHQYRYNPAWRQLRAWLDEGAIGHWHLAQFEVWRPHADHGAQVTGATPWRGLRSHSRGGVLLDHGTHLLYLVLDVAGAPLAVHAWTGRLRHRDYDVEDTAQLLLEYADRAVTLFLTWAGTRRENRIRFVGERGTAEWVGGLLRLETPERHEELDFTAALDKSAYKDWFAALFTRFAGAMDAQDGIESLEEIGRVASILEQAYSGAPAAP